MGDRKGCSEEGGSVPMKVLDLCRFALGHKKPGAQQSFGLKWVEKQAEGPRLSLLLIYLVTYPSSQTRFPPRLWQDWRGPLDFQAWHLYGGGVRALRKPGLWHRLGPGRP